MEERGDKSRKKEKDTMKWRKGRGERRERMR